MAHSCIKKRFIKKAHVYCKASHSFSKMVYAKEMFGRNFLVAIKDGVDQHKYTKVAKKRFKRQWAEYL